MPSEPDWTVELTLTVANEEVTEVVKALSDVIPETVAARFQVTQGSARDDVLHTVAKIVDLIAASPRWDDAEE